ncbi:hypothetical protein DB30_03086 [Enhygromyxa salina]|uniref:Uncharacterized protein n=1 Tax=Enhygromyxa salina TaxID=215803 RepID=A0A0C2D7K7_9BACT|nr:hypothetical protein [Enhygromyxa salina]KIG17605.1 hypothetical protein DB30_03086 [Enhygromyxa salina]
MGPQASIDVELEPDAAIELVAASFAAGRGWAIEREGLLALSIRRKRAFDYYFELEPGPDTPLLTPTVGLEVEARPLERGGAHVRAWTTHHDWLSQAAFLVADLSFFFGFHTFVAGVTALEQRRSRRRGKRRLVALAIEPLVPHQRAADPGPFRRGR